MTSMQGDKGHRPRKRLARQVLEEERICWLCAYPARPGDPLTADHVVPVVLGGATVRENLRAAHRSCNSRRGARLGAALRRRGWAPIAGERRWTARLRDDSGGTSNA